MIKKLCDTCGQPMETIGYNDRYGHIWFHAICRDKRTRYLDDKRFTVKADNGTYLMTAPVVIENIDCKTTFCTTEDNTQ